ncbi:hypothetical protein LUZ60_007146 [Juncus effusus]|nr:hypothetical protein LUZ60_007146 [Juncus effusus]
MAPPPARHPPFAAFTPPYPSPPHLLSLITAAFSVIRNSPPLFSPLRQNRRGLTLYPIVMNPPPNPAPLSFASVDSLSNFISPRLRGKNSLASWGSSPGTKTLHNLFLELSLGETALLISDETLIRTVQVASINIRNPNGSVLIEAKQLMSDGSIRERSRPLSEKMKPLESLEEAVKRAVREELGEAVIVEILDGSSSVRVEERESVSYPGLAARYVLHSVEARVIEGLPLEGEFETEETGEHEYDGTGEDLEGKAVTVKKHYWKWVDDYERDLGR